MDSFFYKLHGRSGYKARTTYERSVHYIFVKYGFSSSKARLTIVCERESSAVTGNGGTLTKVARRCVTFRATGTSLVYTTVTVHGSRGECNKSVS